MLNLDGLEKDHAIKSKYYVTSVRTKQSDNTLLLYVPLDKVAKKVTSNHTSERQLDNLARKLSIEYSINVEIVYKSTESHEELESGYLFILNNKFKGKILELYISSSSEEEIDVWLATNDENETLKEEISVSLNNIIDESSLKLRSIQWANPAFDLPTLPYILKTIKIHQPIDLKSLAEIITTNYPSANNKWINRSLDKLRKSKFLIREKSGYYQLCEQGLVAVPSQASSSSSDVVRALALGKRKW